MAMNELLKPKKKEFNCMTRIHEFMAATNPEIKPYGQMKQYEKGYIIWGEQIVNGKRQNKLYYVDLDKLAIWRGIRYGWIRVVTRNKNLPLQPSKKFLTFEENIERIRLKEWSRK